MGTSATIHVEGVKEVCVYKHWDGHPDSTLPWLEWFNEDFKKNRGDDPSYKFAQLLRSSIRNSIKFNLDKNKHTGWGVEPKHTGGEYNYLLKRDGTVEIL